MIFVATQLSLHINYYFKAQTETFIKISNKILFCLVALYINIYVLPEILTNRLYWVLL